MNELVPTAGVVTLNLYRHIAQNIQHSEPIRGLNLGPLAVAAAFDPLVEETMGFEPMGPGAAKHEVLRCVNPLR